jgi:hypothetical protein
MEILKELLEEAQDRLRQHTAERDAFVTNANLEIAAFAGIIRSTQMEINRLRKRLGLPVEGESQGDTPSNAGEEQSTPPPPKKEGSGEVGDGAKEEQQRPE